jgi:hypothetical protein
MGLSAARHPVLNGEALNICSRKMGDSISPEAGPAPDNTSLTSSYVVRPDMSGSRAKPLNVTSRGNRRFVWPDEQSKRPRVIGTVPAVDTTSPRRLKSPPRLRYPAPLPLVSPRAWAKSAARRTGSKGEALDKILQGKQAIRLDWQTIRRPGPAAIQTSIKANHRQSGRRRLDCRWSDLDQGQSEGAHA